VAKAYAYYTEGYEYIDVGYPTDAMTYYLNAYVPLTVTYQTLAGERTATYLIWKDTTTQLSFRITPKPVTIKSEDARIVVSSDGVIPSWTAGFFYPVDENGETHEFIGGTIASFIRPTFKPGSDFAPGVCSNYFTYTWKTGVNPDNYDLTVEYGELTVDWNVAVTYVLRLRSIRDSAPGYSYSRLTETFEIANPITKLETWQNGTEVNYITASGATAALRASSDDASDETLMSLLTLPHFATGFKVTGFEFNGTAGELTADSEGNAIAEFSPAYYDWDQTFGRARLTVFVEPDGEAIAANVLNQPYESNGTAMNGQTFVYDGQGHKLAAKALNPVTLTASDFTELYSAEASVAQTTIYYLDGSRVSSPVNADLYEAHVYVAFSFTFSYDEEGETEEELFIILAQTDDSLTLEITPRPVTITVPDRAIVIGADGVIRDKATGQPVDYTAFTGEVSGMGFIAKDGYVFLPDTLGEFAIGSNPGYYTFDWGLETGLRSNYDVTTVAGSLEVSWEIALNYRLADGSVTGSLGTREFTTAEGKVTGLDALIPSEYATGYAVSYMLNGEAVTPDAEGAFTVAPNATGSGYAANELTVVLTPVDPETSWRYTVICVDYDGQVLGTSSSDYTSESSIVLEKASDLYILGSGYQYSEIRVSGGSFSWSFYQEQWQTNGSGDKFGKPWSDPNPGEQANYPRIRIAPEVSATGEYSEPVITFYCTVKQ
jgi:hypothetical protein